jgi:eukaryotic-like serine/threonine-protein kinase
VNNVDPYNETQDGPENPSPPNNIGVPEHPRQIGRYRIEKVLGKGGFGIVYLAQDEQLNRRVAVKVPHAKLIAKPEDAEAYLAEARTVANLDHPGIVPVHDVGSTEECPCFIVSRYIPGDDLATMIKRNRPKYREAAEIVATVAESLHYAHKQGLVHRDVKPGNILIGNDDKPYVVDFGLALREENIGKGPKHAGTPAYMSPEQARGEGHRVDGRSDVFSLGIVLYELLSGRTPFRGDTLAELFEQVTSYEARPLRQYDERLPKELERICNKAMAKRANDRYSSAHDMAEDLRHFLTEQTIIQSGASPGGKNSVASELQASKNVSTSLGSVAASSSSLGIGSSDNQPIKIVPKGLRSFDAYDADFFLELLPGPRDREGLPDSLRFWKTRIEETDPDNTFKVGLIYGPSGCGKSSLVKAGLLPRLSEDVISVYVEATPEETETRLLHGLRKRCPGLEDNLTMKQTMAELRRGHGIPFGKKVLIVLDQFEQWLHAKKEEGNTDLVQALRQCDGGRVQCIVMVRDDFWLSVSRFLRDLEVRLLEGENSALTDLFDLEHARKVLVAFGRAFGKLPENISEITKEQKDFVKQSVAGLAEEGKVICVRLALFAEMMKGKSWTPATLDDVGGTTGVGVTFLEETFAASTAPPERRYHQNAARAVLNALLPDSGTEIKGEMKSRDELLAVSGYSNRPRDFDELLRILDNEIRLITPTDPEGKDSVKDSRKQTQEGQTYFQLTHDYLVPSLRDWLTRKQRETRKGRAELKLAERSAMWKAKRENRFLPSLTECLSIFALTDRKLWSVPQQEMMRRATRVHTLRSGVTVALLMVIVSVGIIARGQVLLQQETTRIKGLVDTLLRAEPAQVPMIAKELESNPEVATSLLSPVISLSAKTVEEKRSQLHARLAMVSRDMSLVEPLLEELFTCKLTYIGPICRQLRPYAGELTEKLRTILKDDKVDANRRFRAATALADFAPESELATWTDTDLQFVTGQLLATNSEFQPLLRENLRPINKRLLPELEKIFSDSKSTDAQRLSAANAFVDYAAEDFPRLSRLITVATPEQYEILYPLISSARNNELTKGLLEFSRESPHDGLSASDRVALGKRRAGAAITLLRQGERETIFDALRFTSDPEALSQFVARCQGRGVTAVELIECLDLCDAGRIKATGKARKTEDRVLFGLLLALGEYSYDELPESMKPKLTERLVNWYATDPSSTVHGATGWLLRRWNKEAEVTRINETPIPYDPTGARDWYVMKINVGGSLPGEEQSNAESKAVYFTMIVFPAGEYTIGSPESEPERQGDETQHRIRLSRPIAVSDHELTWRNFDPIDQGKTRLAWQKQFGRTLEATDPAFGVNWSEAIGYCRWLSTKSGIQESNQCYENPENLTKDDEGNVNYETLDLNGRGFRLPTESELEVICRGEIQTAYSFGNDDGLLRDYGWYLDNSNKWSHPVGNLRPSIRGLFDLHGNMFEWCHDQYADYVVDLVEEDPLGPLLGSDRVRRGGGWLSEAAICRSAYRSTLVPSIRTSSMGIRLVLNPSIKSPEGDKEAK